MIVKIKGDDVSRNLDPAALRALAAVADTGGVTRAAAALHLTQSAVSMQLRRLEEALGSRLLERVGRGVSLTPEGEQLLGYARRILALNDEAWARLTHRDFEGEVGLGVPTDIVYPTLPPVLQRFAAEFPRVRLRLVSSYTRRLRAMRERGEIDVILTTEDAVGPGGAALGRRGVAWIGAAGGSAWRGRPLRLAFEATNILRPGVCAALDAAGVPWEMAVLADSSRTVEACVSADLAVHAAVEGTEPPLTERIAHGGALPALPSTTIGLYLPRAGADPPVRALADMLRAAYGGAA